FSVHARRKPLRCGSGKDGCPPLRFPLFQRPQPYPQRGCPEVYDMRRRDSHLEEETCALAPKIHRRSKCTFWCTFLEFQRNLLSKIKDLDYGGPGGTRSPNQAVMSRRL